MSSRTASTIVFLSSAAVLVMEIVANRLVAPYVGVSLETFTGIIGVVLAGIAAGAAVGGRYADRVDPRRLLGPALAIGGALVWLSVPIVRIFGPSVDSSPPSIVFLATVGFFAPSAVLSAVTPIVAKLRLESLDDTGSVFGGLSAAGTAGGLAGTFLTGFVFVTLLGSRSTLFAVGALMVATAVVVEWWLRRRPPGAVAVVLTLLAGLTVYGFGPACDRETRYSCATVVEEAGDASQRSLFLDGDRHGHVDLDDPTLLDIRYIRLFADVVEAMPAGPLDVLHLGGGAFTMPGYVEASRPGSTNHVLELDPGVVDIARDRLGLVLDDDLTVDVGDARTAMPDLPTAGFDLVVGDAFNGQSVPWHLTTVEVAGEIERLLRPGGIYVMNVIDGGDNGFARAEIATLRARFEHVAVIFPDDATPRRARNQVLVASDRPLPELDLDPADGVLVSGGAVDDYVGGAEILTDDHAPADQLSAT